MTRTWPACNEALKRRGALAIWFDPELTREAAPTGRRGRQQTCSDAAIQTCRTVKVLFGMALRQTTGFVENLLRPPGSGWSGYHRRRRVETRLHGAKLLGRRPPGRGASGPYRRPERITALRIPITDPLG